MHHFSLEYALNIDIEKIQMKQGYDNGEKKKKRKWSDKNSIQFRLCFDALAFYFALLSTTSTHSVIIQLLFSHFVSIEIVSLIFLENEYSFRFTSI